MGIPQRFLVINSSFSSLKFDILKEAKKNKLSNALIFIKVSWGNRLFAQLRGYGISASLAQKSYSFIDHCLLEQALRQARYQNQSASDFSEELNRLLALDPKSVRGVKNSKLNGDKTLRLRPDAPLRDFCAEEIAYDRDGYTVYLGSLRANTPPLDGEFIVARDLRERNAELRSLFPERDSYLYLDGTFRKM